MLKKVLELAKKQKPMNFTKGSNSVGIFYLDVGGKNIHYLRDYSSCRGFVHDALKGKMELCEALNEAMTLDWQVSMYLACMKQVNMTKQSFELVEDFCKTLGYKQPEMFEAKKGGELIFKLDMEIFKNLYAVSLLFLLFKQPEITRKVETMKEFVQNYWTTHAVVKRVESCLDNWREIFPEKFNSWAGMYGAPDISSLHDEGMTELLKGRSAFVHVRERANKVLGGVTSSSWTESPYRTRMWKIEGPVTELVFTHN